MVSRYFRDAGTRKAHSKAEFLLSRHALARTALMVVVQSKRVRVTD